MLIDVVFLSIFFFAFTVCVMLHGHAHAVRDNFGQLLSAVAAGFALVILVALLHGTIEVYIDSEVDQRVEEVTNEGG